MYPRSAPIGDSIMTDLNHLYLFTCELAKAAGELIQAKAKEPRTLHKKGFRDIVTDADFAAQKLITTKIQEKYPHHGFLPEEKDHMLPSSGEWIWIIDPVDGTSNYSRGIPNYCVSIAAAKQVGSSLDVHVGAVYDPIHDELFSAQKGKPAVCNERTLRRSPVDEISESVFTLDWSRSPENRAKTLQILNHMVHETRTIRAIGTAALAICWIADGRVDSYINYDISPWDNAAAQLILHEAGGRVSNFANKDWHWQQRDCLASNGRFHEAICAHLLRATT